MTIAVARISHSKKAGVNNIFKACPLGVRVFKQFASLRNENSVYKLGQCRKLMSYCIQFWLLVH